MVMGNSLLNIFQKLRIYRVQILEMSGVLVIEFYLKFDAILSVELLPNLPQDK